MMVLISLILPFKLLIVLSFSHSFSMTFMIDIPHLFRVLTISAPLSEWIKALAALTKIPTHYTVFFTFLFFHESAVSITLMITVVINSKFLANWVLAELLLVHSLINMYNNSIACSLWWFDLDPSPSSLFSSPASLSYLGNMHFNSCLMKDQPKPGFCSKAD